MSRQWIGGGGLGPTQQARRPIAGPGAAGCRWLRDLPPDPGIFDRSADHDYRQNCRARSGLESALALNWRWILAPRLLNEAQAQAIVLAQSQGVVFLEALGAADHPQQLRRLADATDHLLLLRDSERGVRFFDAIELQVDYEVVAAPQHFNNMGNTPPTFAGLRWAAGMVILVGVRNGLHLCQYFYKRTTK